MGRYLPVPYSEYQSAAKVNASVQDGEPKSETARTWLLKHTTGGPQRTTSNKLRHKAKCVLLLTWTLSGSDDTTERRSYFWNMNFP